MSLPPAALQHFREELNNSRQVIYDSHRPIVSRMPDRIAVDTHGSLKARGFASRPERYQVTLVTVYCPPEPSDVGGAHSRDQTELLPDQDSADYRLSTRNRRSNRSDADAWGRIVCGCGSNLFRDIEAKQRVCKQEHVV